MKTPDGTEGLRQGPALQGPALQGQPLQGPPLKVGRLGRALAGKTAFT
jgi:hypothetical protein